MFVVRFLQILQRAWAFATTVALARLETSFALRLRVNTISWDTFRSALACWRAISLLAQGAGGQEVGKLYHRHVSVRENMGCHVLDCEEHVGDGHSRQRAEETEPTVFVGQDISNPRWA